MDINKLVLSQYIKSHPITSAKMYMRRNYFLTLQYLVASTEQQDLWSNKVMELYREQWNQSDQTEPYKSVRFISRMITRKYKFRLSVKCWGIHPTSLLWHQSYVWLVPFFLLKSRIRTLNLPKWRSP